MTVMFLARKCLVAAGVDALEMEQQFQADAVVANGREILKNFSMGGILVISKVDECL